jgi:hypothetical protein
VRDGAWHDHFRGHLTFVDYVETVRLPSKQVETSMLAAYRSHLDKHFNPTFGKRPMGVCQSLRLNSPAWRGHGRGAFLTVCPGHDPCRRRDSGSDRCLGR